MLTDLARCSPTPELYPASLYALGWQCLQLLGWYACLSHPAQSASQDLVNIRLLGIIA